MQKEIKIILRHPFGFVLSFFSVGIIYYGVAQVYNFNTYSIELATNSIFLFGCLMGVVIAFMGRRGMLCKVVIVFFAVVCWGFVFRGYLFSSYYQKKLDDWANEQKLLGDQQWERERNEAHRQRK